MEEARITVLYFADAARRAGRDRESLPLPAGSGLAALRREIFRRHPRLSEIAGILLWSVDEEMAPGDAPLRPGQRVGVLPPFSGG